MVQRLRAVWQQPDGRGPNAKAESARAEEAFRVALLTEANAGRFDELLRFVQDSQDRVHRDQVVYQIQQCVLFECIERIDRPRLLRLLSTVPITGSGYWSLEVALEWGREYREFPDGLVMLFDAFDAAEAANVRRSLFLAAWRAFGDLPSASRDEGEYMRAARPWYAANRERLERVRAYDHNDFTIWEGDFPSTNFSHMFKVK